MVTVAFIAAAIIGILAPEGFLTFTSFIGTSLVVITGFALTLYSAARTREKVEEVEKQTNGRLTSRDREIARLEAALISNGLGNVVAEKIEHH